MFSRAVPRERKSAAGLTKRKPLAKMAPQQPPQKEAHAQKEQKETHAQKEQSSTRANTQVTESETRSPAPAREPEPARAPKGKTKQSEKTQPAPEDDIFGLFSTDSRPPDTSTATSSADAPVDMFADGESTVHNPTGSTD